MVKVRSVNKTQSSIPVIAHLLSEAGVLEELSDSGCVVVRHISVPNERSMGIMLPPALWISRP
jgi:hypothetical protein